MTEVLDRFAPIKTIQVCNNYAPWISKNTRSLMKERDLAQHRASHTGLPTDWVFYSQLKNQATRQVKSDKSQWIANKLKTIGDNSSLVWRNLRDLFGWKRQGPKDLVRIMNDHFLSKIQNHVFILLLLKVIQLNRLKRI